MGIFSELLKAFLPSSHAFIFLWILATIGIIATYITIERWIHISQRTDYDAPLLFSRIHELIVGGQREEASNICFSGGHRALPRILAAGIKKAEIEPALVRGAMYEESQHMTSALEHRLGHLVMLSNVCTLFGLLGTVFGLIMSFTAVSKPGVNAIEKSSMLAAGISAAMNSTLVGLTLSVLCVIAYAFLRAKVDSALHEIDRYAVAILNTLNPPDAASKMTGSLTRRSGDEDEPADTDVTPMLNLMVILIPVLLTSSEFVKIGMIDMKLPEASGGGGGGGGGGPAAEEIKLDLGVVITAKGFSIFHSLQKSPPAAAQSLSEREPDVPKKGEAFDFEGLNAKLYEVKRQVLAVVTGLPASTALDDLYRALNGKTGIPYADHESVKIVGEEKIQYQTVVGVMDAARAHKDESGISVPMFPNVSIAGGIVQ